MREFETGSRIQTRSGVANDYIEMVEVCALCPYAVKTS